MINLKYIASDIVPVKWPTIRKKTWNGVISEVLVLSKHQDLTIIKSKLPVLPQEFHTRLADEDGQNADFGLALEDGTGIHVKEYDDYYKIHWDQKDPNVDPLGHLIYDSPGWIVAGAVGALAVDELFLKGKYRKKAVKTVSNLINSLF